MRKSIMLVALLLIVSYAVISQEEYTYQSDEIEKIIPVLQEVSTEDRLRSLILIYNILDNDKNLDLDDDNLLDIIANPFQNNKEELAYLIDLVYQPSSEFTKKISILQDSIPTDVLDCLRKCELCNECQEYDDNDCEDKCKLCHECRKYYGMDVRGEVLSNNFEHKKLNE